MDSFSNKASSYIIILYINSILYPTMYLHLNLNQFCLPTILLWVGTYCSKASIAMILVHVGILNTHSISQLNEFSSKLQIRCFNTFNLDIMCSYE